MAEQEYWIGSLGPYTYEDAPIAGYPDVDKYPDGETLRALRGPQLLIENAPTADNEVVRLVDLAGVGPSPATTVVTEQTFDQEDLVGTSINYAREDHTHGTPVDPAPGLVPIGGIIGWTGVTSGIPTNYALCDGTDGTPDLTALFVA